MGEKICFDLDIVQREGGGLTQIQIVQGTIKFFSLFSAKFLIGVQDSSGGVGGQGNFDNI